MTIDRDVGEKSRLQRTKELAVMPSRKKINLQKVLASLYIVCTPLQRQGLTLGNDAGTKATLVS